MLMISVIILTYNREKLVGRAIESILGQTFTDFELIIVDNGSTDQSGQIAEGYAQRDSRIKVIHKERGNIGSGRNVGLDAARGDYITFIDDDDWVEPTYLAYLHQLAVTNEADIAICGSWREVNGVKQDKYVFNGVFTYNGEEAVCEMLKREKFNAGMPTKLIASALFQYIRCDEQGKYDDIKITYKLLAESQCVIASGIPLYTCMRHENNNSFGTAQNEPVSAEQVEEYLTAFQKRTKWLTERFPANADFWLYAELSYALSMYDKLTDEVLRTHLKRLLNNHERLFQQAKKYCTKRDKDLFEKYGLPIC